MSIKKLSKYREKRNFHKTSEPNGEDIENQKTKLNNLVNKNLIFVVQHHLASHDHYDFRLEWKGVLISFAVPKGPSFNPKDKRLAVRVEDHPLSYAEFEGTIPKGEYGGGTVMLWDKGTYEPKENFSKGLKEGVLKFVLNGNRLKGQWTLIRLKDGEKNWLLIKEIDQYCLDHPGIDSFKNSVKTLRTMNEIAKGKTSPNGKGAKNKSSKNEKNKYKIPFEEIDPQLCTLVDKVPTGKDFIYEIKYDGYRILAYAEDGFVKLITRNHKDFSEKFLKIKQNMGFLSKNHSFVIDGEVIVADEQGRSDFQALQNYMRKGGNDPIFVAFDLLALDGKDLRIIPLLERKNMLKNFLHDSPENILYAEYFENNGEKLFKEAYRRGLEGIVAKRKNSLYKSQRNEDWFKIKCYRRQEFVVAGYISSDKKKLSAILLGVYNCGKLVYIGKCGTGFDADEEKFLLKKFEEVESEKCYFSEKNILQLVTKKSVFAVINEKFSGRVKESKIFWLKPSIVAEIQFAEVTEDGLLRQASFKGLREDKKAKEIILENYQKNSKNIQKNVNNKKNIQISEYSYTPKENDDLKNSNKKIQKIGKNRKFLLKENKIDKKNKFFGIEISHPNKVIFKKPRLTKFDIANYYSCVSYRMMPFLKGRLLSVVRVHNSLLKGFYKKHPTVEQQGVERVSLRNGEGKEQEYFALIDESGLLEQIQLGTLEFHMWGSLVHSLEKPDIMVFDLDPDKKLDIDKIRQGVKDLKKVLDNLGLKSFLKTSGGKGYHICVPLKPNVDWQTFHDFAEKVAHLLEEKYPERYTTNIRKKMRSGKIFIDFMRNTKGATSVAPYSIRARNGAKVSCPLSWRELDKVAPDDIDVYAMLDRLKKSDPWKDFENTSQSLKGS